MFKRTYNTFVRYTRNANRYYIDIILYKQLIPISLIKLIRLIAPIELITYHFVLFFHIMILNTCSFGFLKTPNWLAKGALLKSN